MQLLRPLRRRDYALLFTGGSVSLMGDGIYLVAIAFQVLALENDATSLSLVLFAWSVGLLACLPLAGVIVDRLDRRAVMVCSDGAQLLATAALGTLSLTGAIEVWHCAAAALVVGAGTAFLKPAATAILPSVVPEDELVPATALQEAAERGSTLFIGPALGGLLVAGVGPGYAFLADAGTFAVSMICVGLIRSPARATQRAAASVVQEARDGLAYVRSEPWLWATLVAAALAVLCMVGPLQVILPYVVKNDWGGEADDYGLLMAVSGAAGFTAALVVGQRGLPRRPVTVMFAVWGVSSVGIVGYGLVGSTMAAAPFALVLGLGYAGEVIWFSLVRLRVPAELLGRVSSLDWLVSFGLMPLSFALCGPLAGLVGAKATLVGSGILAGGACLLVYLAVPGVREDARAATR